jgi:cation diffusion facilitator family transporter
MSEREHSHHQHSHTFGQDMRRPAETRTRIVIGLTALTMVAEITAGIVFGSMALLADGLHMASHATALTISAFAYAYARRHAANPAFSFGTGKVNALGGFTGAVLLATFAAVMAWESVQRLIEPVAIAYNQAIVVAALGLLVNGASVLILNAGDHAHSEDEHHHHHDHNLKAAYLHVMADALTSVLAIVALLSAKYFGVVWIDPVVGIVGAILVARWSIGLLRVTSDVLLDRQAPDHLLDRVRASIEDGYACRVVDLHVWSIGSGSYSAIIGVEDPHPLPAEGYRARIPAELHLDHVTIETHYPAY